MPLHFKEPHSKCSDLIMKISQAYILALIITLSQRKGIRRVYEGLKQKARCLRENKSESPLKIGSETTLDEFHQALDDDTTEDEFNPETSHFSPELSDDQKNKFFAVHGQVEVAMGDRRQVWLPREFYEDLFEERVSYFSEKSAKMQNLKLKLLNKLYIPNYGKYRISGGLILDKYYEPRSLISVTSFAFSSDSGYIARGHGNGIVKIWNVGTDSHVTIEPYEDSSRVTRIKFLEKPDTTSLIAVTRQGNIYMCSQKQKAWQCDIYAREPGNEIEAFDLAARNKRFVTVGKDASIRVYNVESQKIEKLYDSYKSSPIVNYLKCFRARVLEDEGHYLRLYAVKFMDDSSSVFFTGGLDGTIKVWDLRVQAAIQNIIGPVINGDTLDSLENKLLCGQWTSEESLQLFDIRKFQPVSISPTNRVLGSRGEFPYCCRFLRDYEKTFISGIHGDLILAGGCGALELISISERVVIWALPDEGNVLSVDNSFPFIGYASSARSFTLAAFSPAVKVFKTMMPFEDMTEPSVHYELEEGMGEGEEMIEEEVKEILEEESISLEGQSDFFDDDYYPQLMKDDDPLNVVNEVVLQYSQKVFNNQGDRFKAVWRLVRKRILRKWLKDTDKYDGLKQKVTEQKELIQNKKHRWCEKTIMVRKLKDGTEVRTPVTPSTKLPRGTVTTVGTTITVPSRTTNPTEEKKPKSEAE